MLLDLLKISRKHGFSPKTCVHVGSHIGQEYDTYKQMGIEKIVFIEPCYKTFKKLEEIHGNKSDVTLINCACGDKNETREMNTGSQNEGQSNSLLEMNKHHQIHPGITLSTTETVEVRTLDSLNLECDLLVMDCHAK